MRDVSIGSIAQPIPHPDGGIFHLLPMDGQDLKKLAKKIVRFEYLTDAKGKTVFNQKGQAVPRFDQDDEAVLEEAMKRCTKITDLALPVYIANVPNKEQLTEAQLLEVVELSLDSDGNPRKEPFVASNSETPVKIGDIDFVPRQVKRDVLSELYEYEAPDEAPAEPEPEAGEGMVAEETPAKPKKKRVEQLVAEWVIEECVKLGRAKRETEVKN